MIPRDVCTHNCDLDEDLGARLPGCAPCTSRALGWEVPCLLGWEAWPGVPAPLAKESFQAEDGLTVARGMRGDELMD